MSKGLLPSRWTLIAVFEDVSGGRSRTCEFWRAISCCRETCFLCESDTRCAVLQLRILLDRKGKRANASHKGHCVRVASRELLRVQADLPGGLRPLLRRGGRERHGLVAAFVVVVVVVVVVAAVVVFGVCVCVSLLSFVLRSLLSYCLLMLFVLVMVWGQSTASGRGRDKRGKPQKWHDFQ